MMRGKSTECVWVIGGEERSWRGGPEDHRERCGRYAGRCPGCTIAGLLSYCKKHRGLDPSHSGVCSMTVSRVYEGVYARDGGKHVELGQSQEGTCFCRVLHNAVYGPVCAFKVYFSEIIIGRKEIDTGYFECGELG